MRKSLLIYFLISFSFQLTLVGREKKNSKQEISALGVLVQYENRSVFSKDKVNEIVNAYKLKKDKTYRSFKVQRYVFLSKLSQNELKKICGTFLRISGVRHCELDLPLKVNFLEKRFLEPTLQCTSKNAVPIFGLETRTFDGVLHFVSNNNREQRCTLFQRIPHPPHRIDGLSTFWAQEYVGADLLRQKIIDLKLEIPENLFEIWDSSAQEHGEKVSNLVAGPHQSSTLPFKKAKAYVNLYGISDYLDTYENHYKDESNEAPAYISNSMGWDGKKLIEQAVEKISQSGTLIITAAGNEGEFVIPQKRRSARNGNALLVSSTSHLGIPSKFSNFSPEVTISAPSNNEITSYKNNGEITQFGGTSGATPLVTAALSAFTAITGYQLDGKEAKTLLSKSAIKYPTLPLPNGMGHGMLNSIKIGEVAFRLKERCSESKECYKKALLNDEIYQFSNRDRELDAKLAKAFPKCHENARVERNPVLISCEEKTQLLNELRRQAFLNSDNSNYWERLSCIHKNEGLTENAKYYLLLSKRAQKSTEEMLLESIDHPHTIAHFFSHPASTKYHKILNKIIQTSKANEEIAEFVLSQEHWKHHPEFIEQIIEARNADKKIAKFVLSQEQWKNRPDFVEKLIKSGNANEEIAEFVLSQQHWKDHPELIKQLSKSKLSDWPIAEFVLSQEHWKTDPELIEWFIERGEANIAIAKYVLSREHWKDHPELVEKLIHYSEVSERKMIDRTIVNEILSKKHWIDVFQKRLGAKGFNVPVTIENIRRYLINGDDN